MADQYETAAALRNQDDPGKSKIQRWKTRVYFHADKDWTKRFLRQTTTS